MTQLPAKGLSRPLIKDGLFLFLLFPILIALPGSAAELASGTRFTTAEIVVDAGSDFFAAYQIEIIASGDARIVGVEGGDHPAFKAAPYYDPAALQGGRIIVAAFSTGTNLPAGRTRVAVLHMHENGVVSYRARLMAAARADGARFSPTVSVIMGSER